MTAANGNNIELLGAALVKLTRKDNPNRSSRQMVYITASARKQFLSLEACMDLGIIPNNFPNTSCNMVKEGTPPRATRITLPDRTCDCLRRQLPPPIQQTLPFPAIQANRAKLKRYLIDRYAASTFNTCEHQPLPMMSGPPMRLLIDENATPVAVRSPSDVPIHFQDRVKAGLERDVRLRVIERVDMNISTGWCQRMVIAAKANGDPSGFPGPQQGRQAGQPSHNGPIPASEISSPSHDTDAWNVYHSVPLHEDDRHYT